MKHDPWKAWVWLLRPRKVKYWNLGETCWRPLLLFLIFIFNIVYKFNHTMSVINLRGIVIYWCIHPLLKNITNTLIQKLWSCKIFNWFSVGNLQFPCFIEDSFLVMWKLIRLANIFDLNLNNSFLKSMISNCLSFDFVYS